MNLTLDVDCSLKTLGVSWNTSDDKIYYSVHPIEFTRTLTKRKVLSEVAKIFDPMDLMCPMWFFTRKN